MIKFLNSKNSVKSATLILIITLTLSNILGLFRDHFLAQKILSSNLDIYYAAFRIPDLMFNVVILGAISSAFIPIFTSFLTKSEEKRAWEVTNSVINLGIICIFFLSLILMVAMPFLVKLLVPSFDAARQSTTVNLARVFLMTPIFFTLSYIIGGILNSFKRFIFYSIAPLVYNLSIIISTFLFAEKYGVYGVAIGVVFGAFAHMAIQLPGVFHLGWRYKFHINIYDPAVRKIGKLMVPRALGLGANQLMLFVFTALASTLAAGSVAAYSLADNIQTMPIVVFGTSFATAIFPTLSEKSSLGEDGHFANYLNKILGMIMFLLTPAAIIVILLRTEIVRLILGSGCFGWEETIRTSSALGYFGLGLIFAGIVPVLAKAFYSKHDTKTPVIISLISIIIAIFLGYLFTKMQISPAFLPQEIRQSLGGVSGLALAYSLGSFINAILLFIIVAKKGWITDVKKIFTTIFKISFAAIIMILTTQTIKDGLGSSVDMQRFWGVLVKTIGAGSIGLISYLLASYLLGLEELKYLSIKKIIMARFGKPDLTEYNEARGENEY